MMPHKRKNILSTLILKCPNMHVLKINKKQQYLLIMSECSSLMITNSKFDPNTFIRAHSYYVMRTNNLSSAILRPIRILGPKPNGSEVNCN